MNSLDKTAIFRANQISDEFGMNSANKATNSKANRISDEFGINSSTKRRILVQIKSGWMEDEFTEQIR